MLVVGVAGSEEEEDNDRVFVKKVDIGVRV